MTLFLSLLVNGLTLGAVYALISLGYSMVYGVLQLLNFANGDLYMVGAFMGVGVLNLAGGPAGGLMAVVLIAAMIVAAMVVAGTLGVATERFAYRRLRTAPRIAPLISALGVSYFLEASALLIVGAGFYTYNTGSLISISSGVHAGPLNISTVQFLVIGSSVLLMIALQILVKRTKSGRAMRAIACDRDASAMMGVDVDKVISRVFLIGGALAGAAGVIAGLAFSRIYFYMGFLAGLKGWTAAVVGGIGSVTGAMVGGLGIGLAESFTAGYLSSVYSDLIVFGILIAFILLRPRGLFGAPALNKV